MDITLVHSQLDDVLMPSEQVLNFVDDLMEGFIYSQYKTRKWEREMETEKKKDGEERFPYGIVLRLHKYVNSAIAGEPSTQTKRDAGERQRFAFGDFDYVSFRPVKKFADYYSESSSGMQAGHWQDVMLYSLSKEENERYFGFTYNDKSGIWPDFHIFQNGKTVEKNFLIISMIYVSGVAKDFFGDYQHFLGYCKKAVEDIVCECNQVRSQEEQITCEVFGSFNSSEIAILWGTDQFVDIQYIVDNIRYLTFIFKPEEVSIPVSAFISTYSIIACGDGELRTEGLRGEALIQLVSRTNCGSHVDRKSSLKFLKDWDNPKAKQKILSCVGQYDFIYCNDLSAMKQVYGVYDGNMGCSDDFRVNFWKHFSRSTTRIVYKEDEISSDLRDLNWDDLLHIEVGVTDCAENISTDCADQLHIAEEKTNLPEDVQNFLEKIKGKSVAAGRMSKFYYELLLLKSDYIQCVSTSPDDRWISDFKEQYITAMRILDFLFDNEFDGTISAHYLDCAQDVIGVLQHQIRHISDAGKLFFEEPYSHLESTGRYDLLFHMYYGIVKEILMQMCKLRDPYDTEEQRQDDLVPIVRFQPVQIICSYIFSSNSSDKLIDISIPYDAWCEPCFYMPFLVHELYHYVSPVDRKTRNRLFMVILVTEEVVAACDKWICELAQTEAVTEQCDDIMVERVAGIILPHIRRGIATFLNETDLLPSSINNCSLPWEEYEQQLVEWGFEKFDGKNQRLLTLLTKVPWNDILCECTETLPGEELDEGVKKLCEVMLREITLPPRETASTALSLSECLKEWSVKNWKPITVQLRELFPDLAMVQFTGATVCDYLMLFSFSQEKLGNSPQDLVTNELYLRVRIGFVIDWILDGFEQDADVCIELMKKNRNLFCEEYAAYVSHSSCRNGDINEVKAVADSWFSFYELLYSDYLDASPYRCILAQLGRSQFSPLCVKEGPITDLCREYFSMLSDTKEEKEGEEFQQNIKTIHTFQRQLLLHDISNRIRERGSMRSTTSKTTYAYGQASADRLADSKPLVIDMVSDLNLPIHTAASYLRRNHCAVFGTDDLGCKLWYRGSQNADHEILPSIMIHFFDKLKQNGGKPDGRNAVGTLWEYQRSILEQFKYRADGAAEFVNPASYSACDYIALMQHYGQYTTYLDWSEDAYTSLYFALEDFVTGAKKEQYPGKNAALYIMDPMLYNRARWMLFNKMNKDHPEEFCPRDKWYHRQSRAIQEMPKGHIPNLSVSYNKRRYGIFSYDVPVEEDVNISREINYLNCVGLPKDATLGNFPMETWNLPLAVYTSRLNPRLRSQSGMFLAFSPFSLPVHQEIPDKNSIGPACFSYLSLLKLQKYFKKEFPDECCFIYEIQIQNYAKKVIGDQLRLAGIGKYKIYPELENLRFEI